MSTIPPRQNGEAAKAEIAEEIERRRRSARDEGLYFTPLPEDQVQRPLSRPIIIWQAWQATPTRGTSLVYTLGLANPSAQVCTSLFVQAFVGTASLDRVPPAPDVAVPLRVDARFPLATSPGFPGLTLAAGEMRSLGLLLPVPSNVEPASYLCNAYLLRTSWHGSTELLDKSLVLFDVS